MTQASISHPRARLPWALVPVALLLSSALGVGSMAIVAVRDPHFATEPDYYQKAIRWDQTQAQAATNQRLGYVVKVPVALPIDEQGHATLELSLSDRSGMPVKGAQLTVEAFANAYSSEQVAVVLQEKSPGRYSARLAIRHPGQWVFQVKGTAGVDRFTADVRADLLRGGST
jgi:nitrogen fixation protein FixH